MNTGLNRTGVALLTNKSAGSVARGDLVIVDTAIASAFTTTTTAGFVNGLIGIVLEPNGIAVDEIGAVAFGIWVPKMNLASSASIGDFIRHHSVVKQGTPHAAPMLGGDFAIALESGTTPAGLLLSSIFQGARRVLIAEVTPSGVGTVTLSSSIPATFEKLTIDYVVRGTESANFSYLDLKFNNDTTAGNYRYQMIFGHSNNTVGAEGGDNFHIASVAAASSPSNSPGAGHIEIPFYVETTFNKIAHSLNGQRYDSSAVHQITRSVTMEWESNATITRIDMALAAGNFVAGSTIRLYGEN